LRRRIRDTHEWEVWQTVKLPDGKILMPGVIETVTAHVEHPELVAQCIVQYATMVGREKRDPRAGLPFRDVRWIDIGRRRRDVDEV
jgi:methionine synthase II (cobalamin-independent)